jgi:hypothetical protein
MPQMNAQQLNALSRSLIKARAVEMLQSVFANTYTSPANQNISASQPVVAVPPRNVGLIRGFWVKVVANVSNGSAVQINLTDFGPANLLSQISFLDLNNNTRIQTTGWHMNFVNTIKERQPFGTAIVRTTGMDSPINYGSNFLGDISAPATIAAAGNGTITMWYYVPLSYSKDDLRGAIYANVLNATMQLNLTFNPIPVVANGTDSTSAIYVGNAAGAVGLAVISSATVTVYQDYLDQLPVGQNGVVLLPLLDLATIYELKNTTLTAIVANNEFPAQYSNFRDFLSTFAVYVNTGATGARGVGLDINYWSLQSANFTNIFKMEPALVKLKNERRAIMADYPPGVYYFGYRERPVSTVQYGNMQLILNALTAGAGAYLMLGFEDFALVQNLSQAGSLAAS